MQKQLHVELFPCSGGMAEGFRRAGVTFDLAVDIDGDACDSYERNLGHRPVQMDVRDLLRLVRDGWRPSTGVRLLVADPPCTPWSRAGKRKGLEDARDMLRETAELIAMLRPRAYLIGNVPGLQDASQWHVVQRVIGGLAKHGYCVTDYVQLDAADYGVPQHRVRPFWFGHLDGPCVSWPSSTHGTPSRQLTFSHCVPLRPWVTCRDALAHLPLVELGKPVRLRWKPQSDHRASSATKPARAATKNTHGDGALLRIDVAAHPPARPDEPAPTVRGGGEGHSAPDLILVDAAKSTRNRPFYNPQPPSTPDEPARTITTVPRAGSGGGGAVLRTSRLVGKFDGGNHLPSHADRPALTVTAAGESSASNVMVLDELSTHAKHPINRVDEPSGTVTTKGNRGAQGACAIEWPWDRPATTVTTRDTIPPPGHHPESGSILSQPNAVVLSEKARAILQGFPDGWHFAGKTKKARSSQIGMAMPPPLAHAVAEAVRAQMQRADEMCAVEEVA